MQENDSNGHTLDKDFDRKVVLRIELNKKEILSVDHSRRLQIIPSPRNEVQQRPTPSILIKHTWKVPQHSSFEGEDVEMV